MGMRPLYKGALEMIKITHIKPLLKPGWIAQDRNGDIYWYSDKPYISNDTWYQYSGACESFKGFGCLQEIEPWADDWKESLIEVGEK